jgi:hypothetical protein
MQSFAVVTYRVAGKQDVQTIRFDLNDPVKRNDWDVFIDSIRAKQIGDGPDAYIRAGVCDYFATSFELTQ